MARTKKAKKLEETIPLETNSEEVKKQDNKEKVECEILKAFTDKYTDMLYEVGKTYKFTLKRIKEIQDKNKDLIKIIKK